MGVKVKTNPEAMLGYSLMQQIAGVSEIGKAPVLGKSPALLEVSSIQQNWCCSVL